MRRDKPRPKTSITLGCMGDRRPFVSACKGIHGSIDVGRRLSLGWLSLTAAGLAAPAASAQPAPEPIPTLDEAAARYAREVDHRLVVPEAEQDFYAGALMQSLTDGGVRVDRMQWVVVVDRSAWAQAVMLWAVAPGTAPRLVGASQASTGRPSGFEHFETPTGVFEHRIDPLDFRAEGTLNEFGIRGYGDRGMRVYDFGWVTARRGWAPGEQPMRLQMHATDRDKLEPRLGRRESKGCIRIPATLNTWIDRYGVLDGAYEEAIAGGRRFWVLRRDRQPTPWSGRYLVVVDSRRDARPDWNPLPGAAVRSKPPALSQRNSMTAAPP
ncbi:MAG: L,D-transpeptidase [Burkholderiaceae bacterium]|nr:L,D-transpeptidase [Burkholderiaceae bacterium]